VGGAWCACRTPMNARMCVSGERRWLLSVRATGISLPSRSQRCNVVTETPRSVAAFPVRMVCSMRTMTPYRVREGKREFSSTSDIWSGPWMLRVSGWVRL
jgi:hypothetical protein